MRSCCLRSSGGPGRIRARASAAILSGAVAVASVACARYQHVHVRSDPPGAEVFVDGTQVGRTPLRLRIDRDADHLVFLKLEGYVPERAVLNLNRASDQIDFLTPADVELRLARRIGAGTGAGADPDAPESDRSVEVRLAREAAEAAEKAESEGAGEREQDPQDPDGAR